MENNEPVKCEAVPVEALVWRQVYRVPVLSWVVIVTGLIIAIVLTLHGEALGTGQWRGSVLGAVVAPAMTVLCAVLWVSITWSSRARRIGFAVMTMGLMYVATVVSQSPVIVKAVAAHTEPALLAYVTVAVVWLGVGAGLLMLAPGGPVRTSSPRSGSGPKTMSA